MAAITFKQNPVHTVGELPAVGNPSPDFELVGTDLAPVRLSDHSGKWLVLNIFPSLDTGTCAASVRTFNQRATDIENTAVLCVSKDLPFAQTRFCEAEGIENVTAGSAFRSSFGEDYGVTMTDGPMAGLLSRAVVVIDESGTVIHTEHVPEISDQPDYDAALAALD